MIELHIDGHIVILDAAFYETIKHRRLSVSKNRNVFYLRSGRDYIHRMVIGAKRGEIVDHINGNGLDNRHSNLRIASRQMNKANTNRGRSQKYIGVSFVSDKKLKRPFCVQVSEGGVKRKIGYFATAEEAARAYDKYAVDRFGVAAILNF